MQIHLKINLWTHKADKKGLCPVVISIRGGGKQIYHNTGVKVLPDHYSDGSILKGSANYDIHNANLRKIIADTERKILLTEGVTIEMVKEWLNPTKSANKTDFIKYAAGLIASKRENTKRRYSFELDKIKEYARNSLSFAEITEKWLTDYYKYLVSGNEKENRPPVQHNTAINAFKVIRHVFNDARDNKIISNYPFAEWKYPQYIKPKKNYLTIADTDKLFKLLDTQTGDGIKLVTAFFLLECFSGIRVSDWSKFKVEKMVSNTDMVLTTTKTGTDVRIPIDLMPSLQRVMGYIKSNNLTYSKGSEYANLMLKEIKTMAGIDLNLTTHVARHTFATMWLTVGLSKTSIAAMMGITERQLSTYAHFDTGKIRNEMMRVGGV